MLCGHVLFPRWQGVRACHASRLRLLRATAFSRPHPRSLVSLVTTDNARNPIASFPPPLGRIAVATEKPTKRKCAQKDIVLTSATQSKARGKARGHAALQSKSTLKAGEHLSADGQILVKPGILLPPRLSCASTADHHDLYSYIQYAGLRGFDDNNNVSKGTRYEYQVWETLKPWGFHLCRNGRAGDEGIDLIGYWYLPNAKDVPLKVILQCKHTKPGPRMIRELAGSYPGAAAGWGSADTVAFLVSSQPKTDGIDTALNRSPQPMGFMQISSDGQPLCIIWNDAADVAGLKGLTVKQKLTTKVIGARGGKVQKSATLYWEGEPLQKVRIHTGSIDGDPRRSSQALVT